MDSFGPRVIFFALQTFHVFSSLPQPVPVITGVGLVTPLGLGADQTWTAIKSGEYRQSTGRCGLAPSGKIPRVTELALLAATSAMGEHSKPTALVVGTSKGPIDDWLKPTVDLSPPALQNSWGLAQIASHLTRSLQLAGPVLTLSGACASGLHALIRAAMLIRTGEARRVLVVAAESSLHPLFLACYQRLGVMTPNSIGCRPFDRSRKGFFVSEAAAAVLLEARDQGAPAHSSDLAQIDRFAMGGDATHITGSDPAGRTLQRLLTSVIDGRPVDLIHAHGTGTDLNDAIELTAIEAVVAGIDHRAPPVVYSHKGAIGHTLGASGLIAIVLNCLAHRDGLIPPNVQTRDPLPTRSVYLSAKNVHRPIHRSLAIAAGFGGATAVVSLIKP